MARETYQQKKARLLEEALQRKAEENEIIASAAKRAGEESLERLKEKIRQWQEKGPK